MDYDANGNLLSVKQEISDPSDPLGNTQITLRKNIWDEENRLRAVDLNPEAPDNKPEIAAYTYDAAGERIVKYLPGRLDAFYSAKAAGSADRLEAIIYPSPLLTVKTKPLPQGINPQVLDKTSITTYTKHYYIGTERIGSALGTMKNLGVLCKWNFPGETQLVLEMNGKVQKAQSVLIDDYITFEKIANLPAPFLYGGNHLDCRGKNHDPTNYHPYWYHPDHLGSSNYITNLAGEINQHMEYLPFGETLVEEHLNSYNSPSKFNAKELDAETGWYYYGARYYNPKWSIWLSVDPLASYDPVMETEFYGDGQHNGGFYNNFNLNSYIYTYHNPVRYIDPNGKQVDVTQSGGIVNIHAIVDIRNKSSDKDLNISKLQNSLVSQTNKLFTKNDANINFSMENRKGASIKIDIVNQIGTPVKLKKGGMYSILNAANGSTKFSGNLTDNVIELSRNIPTLDNNFNLTSDKRSLNSVGKTFRHELGHLLGLHHPFSPLNDINDIDQNNAKYFGGDIPNGSIRNNFMNSDQNKVPSLRNSGGNKMTLGQMEKLINQAK